MSPSRKLIPLLLLALGCRLWSADLEPGLIGEYFGNTADFPGTAAKTPTFLRIDATVNFGSTVGNFYKTKLVENFAVRWSGVVKIAKAGTYSFGTFSDDGSRLSIDGKLIEDNSGMHPMTRKDGNIELSAGDHPILVEFYQGGGEAGCQLFWTPPGGVDQPIPAANLAHDPKAFQSITWDPVAWKKMSVTGPSGNGKYAVMDHGPFVTGTFVQPSNLCTAKGIAIYLDDTKTNIAIFDPELLRFSYGATAAQINYPAGRDGIEGQPSVIGTDIFSADVATGWAQPGTENFTDARVRKQGNLPRDWAFYRGLYLDGTAVTLSYTVGTAQVLEHPSSVTDGTLIAMTRNLTLSGNSQPLTMLIAENHSGQAAMNGSVGTLSNGDFITYAGVVGGGSISAADGSLTLTIPAGTKNVSIAICSATKDDAGAFRKLLARVTPADNHALTKGGKGRWGASLDMPGTLGSDAGPYAVDTITVPYVNPAQSYMRLTGHDFFSDGHRAAVSTMDGDVWIVSGIDATLSNVTWKRFATGLFQPLGVRIVKDQVYVICRDRLMRLTDLDGDGEADFYESFNSDCPVTKHYHEFALDLETDKEGNFYYGKGSNLGAGENDATSEMQGSVLKVSKDGSSLTRYCTGMREPNGMGGGDGYPLLNSDNQGNWTPVDRINLLKPGGFFGFRGTSHQTPVPNTYDPPICWTPYNLDNSPGGLAFDPTTEWGPFKDMPVGLSYGKSCIFIVLMEQVDGGIPQGGIVFFPLNFASGTMRARFNAVDHQLYVTGMHGWQTNAVQDGDFQRVRYTGKPVYMPTSLHIHPDAVEIGFPFPLDPETAKDAGNFAVEQWNYRWTSNYGSEDWSVADPNTKGHDKVDVAGVTLSADKKSVTIKIPGLKPVMQMKIKFKLDAADGAPVNLELYNTINKIPAQ